MQKVTFTALFFIIFILQARTQTTVGLIKHATGCTDDGYILFTPYSFNKTYLIDKCGRLVHSWDSKYTSGRASFLLKDGTLLKTGHAMTSRFCTGGVMEKINWEGKVVWNYSISDSLECQHHDIIPLPNGNILAIVSLSKSKKTAIEAGRDSLILDFKLNSEKIIELQPIDSNSAKIVWEWDLWDHLIQEINPDKQNYGIISKHPELVNINYAPRLNSPDWVHLNSIDYNPELDQILLSSLNFNEIWIIDHSTSTIQAATHKGGNSGKGGDILYRWGNPAAYNQGNTHNQKLFGQHNAHWIEKKLPYAGNIMIFNNGVNRPGLIKYSTVEIIKPPVNSKGIYSSISLSLPEKPLWMYGDSVNSTFYSTNFSGAQMLPNGNVVIYSGQQGNFFEIDSMKNIVWNYINPVDERGPVEQGMVPGRNQVFRGFFYFYNYAGFRNRSLISGQPIEQNPSFYICP
jgi:hypothetical protein